MAQTMSNSSWNSYLLICFKNYSMNIINKAQSKQFHIDINNENQRVNKLTRTQVRNSASLYVCNEVGDESI